MWKPWLVGLAVWAVLAAGICAPSRALANGGPFVIRYPSGDPAAKGVLARLDPDLKPARETRLRVVKEDLKITFGVSPRYSLRRESADAPPLVSVSAAYVIQNPTDKEITVDFGFPILRGVYMRGGMELSPDIEVLMSGKPTPYDLISNSAIYGIIRQRARATIDEAIAKDKALAAAAAAVRNGKGADRTAARGALAAHMTGRRRWNARDAALLVEYAGLDFGKSSVYPRDRWFGDWGTGGDLANANLGPLGAIGEQKATQFFAQLASCFDPKAGATYEGIFTAWGGDVRERSVDLQSGNIRPREITVKPGQPPSAAAYDPTVYARVAYLDADAKISEAEKASCKAILRNLPVVFTFAPMNLLHYQVTFPAKSRRTLTIRYTQFAYTDTRKPASYQLAYVVHPASLWKSFGPINLQVAVPKGVRFRASVGCKQEKIEDRGPAEGMEITPCAIYRGVVKRKTGELFLAVEMEGWKKAAGAMKPTPSRPAKK